MVHQTYTRSTRRDVLKGMGGAAVTISLTGCLQNSNSSGPSLDADNPPKKPDKLTVRAWGGNWQESLKKHVSDPFSKETSIKIEHDTTEDVIIQNKIRQAIKQNRAPPVNVQWSTTKLTYRAFTSGVLAPLNPNIVTNLSNLLSQAQPDVESDSPWPFTSLYTYSEPLTYNTNLVESEPTSWTEWWNSEWRNSLGIYARGDSSIEFVAKLTGTPITADSDFTAVWDKFRKLKPNVGLIGDDTNLTQGVREGELAQVCMVIANTVSLQRNNAPVDFTVPKEGCAVGRDAMYTPKGQNESKLYWSQKYINKATSRQQGPWLKELGVTPLNKNAPIPDYMKKNAAFPTTEKEFEQLILVPPEIAVKRGPEWEQKFKQIFSG